MATLVEPELTVVPFGRGAGGGNGNEAAGMAGRACCDGMSPGGGGRAELAAPPGVPRPGGKGGP